MTERHDFTAGLIVGALFGVALGLLFAPQPGTDTRDRLRREGERLRERARVRADDVAGQARRAAEDMTDRMRGSDLVNRALDAAGDAIARGRAAFEAKADRVRRTYEQGRGAAETAMEEPTNFGEPEN